MWQRPRIIAAIEDQVLSEASQRMPECEAGRVGFSRPAGRALGILQVSVTICDCRASVRMFV